MQRSVRGFPMGWFTFSNDYMYSTRRTSEDIDETTDPTLFFLYNYCLLIVFIFQFMNCTVLGSITFRVNPSLLSPKALVVAWMHPTNTANNALGSTGLLRSLGSSAYEVYAVSSPQSRKSSQQGPLATG
jgi:hypothetical protein